MIHLFVIRQHIVWSMPQQLPRQVLVNFERSSLITKHWVAIMTGVGTHGIFDVILHNERGEITETTIANIAIYKVWGVRKGGRGIIESWTH